MDCSCLVFDLFAAGDRGLVFVFLEGFLLVVAIKAKDKMGRPAADETKWCDCVGLNHRKEIARRLS
jgi:hypothetical protein